MERNSLIVLSLLLLLLAGPLCAQEPDMPDSVFVTGTVVDHLTGEPQPYSIVQLLRGTDTAATAMCDEEGDFATDRVPAGAYTLNVILDGRHVYQMDMVLGDNASLNIAVITDTFSIRTLRPAEVKAIKRMLGTLLISSVDDTRLWDFSGQMDFSDRSASNDLSGGIKRTSSTLCHPGLKYHPFNSSMKNDIILYGRILDTRRPAPADTTKTAK